MKRHIEKIKAQGPEYSKRVVMILAGVTTAVVVIVWLVLVSVFKTESQAEPQETSAGPDFETFIQQAGDQFSEIGTSIQQGNQEFNLILQQQEQAQLDGTTEQENQETSGKELNQESETEVQISNN